MSADLLACCTIFLDSAAACYDCVPLLQDVLSLMRGRYIYGNKEVMSLTRGVCIYGYRTGCQH